MRHASQAPRQVGDGNHVDRCKCVGELTARRRVGCPVFFFSSRRRHTRCSRDWSSDVCSSDLFANELTTADLTAVSLFQATLPVPGRVIPNDPAVERANLMGEALFNKIGCATCHATLSLTSNNNPGLPEQPGWIYFEPNPYNPATGPNAPNLQLGPASYPVSAPALTVDLTSNSLPLPRLSPQAGVVVVPAYTDLKL